MRSETDIDWPVRKTLLAPIAEGEALRLNVLLTISGQHRAFTFWTTAFVPVALFDLSAWWSKRHVDRQRAP
jgi:hypothetical protein